MRTKLIVAGVIIVAFFAGLCTSFYGVPGKTENGGITVHFGTQYYGLEIWGTPGFFSEDCSGGC